MSTDNKRRTFKMVDIEGGKPLEGDRYYTGAPSSAARKAFNKWCKEKKLKKCKKTFTMKESTKGSKNKTYSYVGQRKKLAQPKEIKRNDTVYKVHYETKVTANRS